MAYTGPGSVPTLVDEFLAHWAGVNALLAPLTLSVVPEGTLLVKTRTDLAVLRTNYANLQGAPGSGIVLPLPAPQYPSIQSLTNTLEINRQAAANGRALVVQAIGAFNRKVRGSLAHTTYPNSLPDTPGENDGYAVILKAAEDMLSVWTNVNALGATPLFTPPLVAVFTTPGTNTTASLTLADATSRVNDLKTAQLNIIAAEKGLDAMRPHRDNTWEREIRPILVAYQKKIQGDYPPESAFVTSLPRIHPAPGHTPEAVNLTGTYNAGTEQGDYAWSASTEATLERYEVRQSPGPAYEAQASAVIATVLPGEALTLSTSTGFEAPGQTSSVKVFVILTTGNERGSNTVTLTRPV
jgi:hypothetical protein